MSNKTAMMKLYDMLDEGQISEIAEIKEYFLMLEQKQIEEAWESGAFGGGQFVQIIDNAKEYYSVMYEGGKL